MPLWIALFLAIEVWRAPSIDPSSAQSRDARPTSESVSASQPPRADSLVTHARAVLAISEFFFDWQRLWRNSATIRASLADAEVNSDVRLPYLHCHPEAPVGSRVGTGTAQSEQFARKFEQFAIVRSEHSTFSACPSWLLSRGLPEVRDERDFRDGALIDPLRPAARDARDRLLVVLTRAAAEFPGSGFLSGQLVRFHLEQGDTVNARRTAARCRAERWWCTALVGYVMDREGRVVEAESTYRAMQALQPWKERCTWQDARDLLMSSEQSNYDRTRCTDGAPALATLWWLSDPLFRVQGNERWVAHQSRLVDVLLRSALDNDERYVWDARRGGDAMVRLIMRYDWPTYVWWDNEKTDVNHSTYLFGNQSPPAAPYTTFEYSTDRVHLLPLWKIVGNPFAAVASDWSLAVETEDGEVDPGWWSTEHFRTKRRLVQLPEGQTVLFRRDSQISVATAHQLRQPLTQPYSMRYDVMLLSTTSASDIDTLQQQIARSGETSVLRAMMPGTPTLLAIEAMGMGSARFDARTRFGVTPPPTLNAMKRGDVAISDPAILSAQSGAGDQRIPDESLLDHLLGSLSFAKADRRFGVYWETYGIAARDTVTISVSLAGDATVSSMRRLGMALNVASDPNRSLSIKWTEPSPQHYTRTLPGPIPVQMRSLLLNVEQLAPGPYILRISVERPGVPMVSSERRVVLRP